MLKLYPTKKNPFQLGDTGGGSLNTLDFPGFSSKPSILPVVDPAGDGPTSVAFAEPIQSEKTICTLGYRSAPSQKEDSLGIVIDFFTHPESSDRGVTV